jgi:hypothetical protein
MSLCIPFVAIIPHFLAFVNGLFVTSSSVSTTSTNGASIYTHTISSSRIFIALGIDFLLIRLLLGALVATSVLEAD